MIDMKKEDCFAYKENIRGWSCAALTVKKCEYPFCKTFKTKKQVVEQKRKCLERINSYAPEYRAYLVNKYGEYIIEAWEDD